MGLDRLARKAVPSLARLTYNPAFKWLANCFDLMPRLMFRELKDLPPNHLRIRVGVGNRLFANHLHYLTEAQGFWLYAFESGLCSFDSVIVDIGCGCGRYAHILRDRRFKTNVFTGKYIGIDIDPEMLAWCRQHFNPAHFEFHQSTHKSQTYSASSNGANGSGAGTAAAPESYYVLPLADQTADLVFSDSLYTHLLENELINYTREAYRVLKPSCHMAMHCFCLDYPPPSMGDRHTFAHQIGNAHVESPAVPEAAVAYSQEFLFRVAREAGFRTAQFIRDEPEDYQPMLLCQK